VDEAIQQRKVQERDLTALLSEKEELETRCAAACLLGCYRVAAAADALAGCIGLTWVPGKEYKRLPIWSEHPAVDALVSIGNPSVPAVLKRIRESDDAIVIELSARVIRSVEGSDLAVFILTREIEKEGSAEVKARLQKALALIQAAPKTEAK
jgi:hypothetical protein